MAHRVLIIPGLNGHPGMLLEAAPRLFPGWQACAFNHHHDQAQDGVEGLAHRALDSLRAREPLFVCGESFGGTVALTMAHLAPERIQGLILLSTFGWHPSALARRGVRALAAWSFLGGRVSTSLYRAGRLASLPTQLGLSFQRELLDSYLARPRADVAAYRTKAELSLTFDARPWLRTVETPAFVLVGRWDPVVPRSAGAELARSLPNATLATLDGGHLVHLVHAQHVGRLIERWARSLR
ncbi:MAG: alpha/beta fold hydrolase [Chloroflexi bacterium]|nr:alpha/beta fold hydrolase [Chloroflexota bacterium]